MRALVIGLALLVALLLVARTARADDFEASLATRHAGSSWVRTRSGVPRDVVENWTWALLGGGRRESEDLTWKASARFDATMRARARSGGGLASPAWGFEVRPWEAWVDFALGDAVRVRAGNQFFVRGKLDVGSPGAMIGAIDLRQGPSAEPDQLRLPVPMVLTTWTPAETVQLEVAWEPLFVPHRFDVLGSNYALLAPTATAAMYRSMQALEAQVTKSTLAALVSDLSRIGAGGLAGGEAMARATWRSGLVDLGLSYGWVRQKLPAVSVRDSRLYADYDRYHQITADAEMVVGAITLAAESGVALGKKQYLMRDDFPLPSIPSPQITGGLKATWVKSEQLAATLEASVTAPVAQPPGGALVGYGGQPILGIAAFGIEPRWERDRMAFHAIATTSGPSAGAIVRYAHSIVPSVEVGIGGAVFFSGSARADSIGAIADRFDQAFVFGEWKP